MKIIFNAQQTTSMHNWFNISGWVHYEMGLIKVSWSQNKFWQLLQHLFCGQRLANTVNSVVQQIAISLKDGGISTACIDCFLMKNRLCQATLQVQNNGDNNWFIRWNFLVSRARFSTIVSLGYTLFDNCNLQCRPPVQLTKLPRHMCFHCFDSFVYKKFLCVFASHAPKTHLR
jgi:hypothetical protein